MKRAAKAMALIRFDLPQPLPETSAVILERLMAALPILRYPPISAFKSFMGVSFAYA